MESTHISSSNCAPVK